MLYSKSTLVFRWPGCFSSLDQVNHEKSETHRLYIEMILSTDEAQIRGPKKNRININTKLLKSTIYLEIKFNISPISGNVS